MTVPHELTGLRQWCISSLTPDPITGKPDKAPRTPSGALASVSDPSTWYTFEECSAAVAQRGGAVGLILTPNDPYCIIDLDKTDDPAAQQGQAVVWREFDGTYAEYSQSGNGVHIVARGAIGGGVRRKGLEIYDRGRYMIFTGNVLRDFPIADMNALLNDLVANLGGIDASGEMPDDLPENESDEVLLNRMMNASNGEKFKRLYYTRPGPDDDWSQCDAALAQFIAFHTRNHEQALRLFRGSVLYDPERKARKSGYKTVDTYEQGYLLGRTFKRQWQELAPDYYHRDKGREYATTILNNWRNEQLNALAEAQARAAAIEYNTTESSYAVPPIADNSIPCPPGLVGQVATYVYQTSPSPVWEIAVAVSITFCSAVFGSKWRTATDNPLGHYTILLAESGTGKTAAASRITALTRAVEDNGSNLIRMLAGPGYIASGQGLLKRFAEQPVMYSYLSEFDSTLRRLDPSQASESYIEFRRVLLEVFDSARIQATAYAQKQDSTAQVEYPVFSFLGDTRAEDFFSLVDDQFARSGFLARLTLIEYSGDIPQRPANYRPHVPPELVVAVNDAVSACDRQRSGVAQVPMDIEAMRHFDDLSRERVAKMNAAKGDQMLRGAWNRIDLRVARLATVIAVGCNPINPMVTLEHMRWAEGIVRWGLERTLGDRVRNTSIGEGESRFEGDVVEFVHWYRGLTVAQRISRKAPKVLAERDDVFPYATFKDVVKWRERYKGHRAGFHKAVDMALDVATKSGLLDQLSKEQCQALGYSGRAPVFCLGEHWEG